MTTSRGDWTGGVFGRGLAYLAAYHLFKLPPVLPMPLAFAGQGWRMF